MVKEYFWRLSNVLHVADEQMNGYPVVMEMDIFYHWQYVFINKHL